MEREAVMNQEVTMDQEAGAARQTAGKRSGMCRPAELERCLSALRWCATAYSFWHTSLYRW